MATTIQGLFAPVSVTGETETRIEAFTRVVYFNETPLIARLPRDPAPSDKWSVQTAGERPSTYTLNAAIASTGATTMVLTGTSGAALQVGDTLEMRNTAGNAVEHVEITADPVVATHTTLTIRRARGGTTAVTQDLTYSTITLVANSRTGKEVDQTGIRTGNDSYDQTVETFQFPVQVGGRVLAVRAVKLPPGQADFWSAAKVNQLTNLMVDMERSCLYSRYEAAAAEGDRPKQRGLRQIIEGYNGASNFKTTGGGSYTSLNLITDGFAKCYAGGGNPDVIMASPDLMVGLATWGFSKQTFPAGGSTVLGVPIEAYVVPLGGKPAIFVPNRTMRAGTIAVLTSSDLKIRPLRNEFWNQRGSRGDAMEGEWLADLAIQAEHPGQHAWIEGITGWA